MIDISIHELNKYYGSNHVLKDISLEIFSGEKVGLLGRNGSGKTTLFKVITGEEDYQSGSLSVASSKKIEILAQIPVFAENDTVEDILRSSFNEVTEIFTSMKKIEGDCDPKVLKRYGRLMEEYERLGGYDVDYKIDKICNGMNISEELRKSPFNLLSGGEKTRVNLTRILLHEADILLLDEPTNHLDLLSLKWLEKFLRDFTGTVVVISHDRVFLDNVVKRIIDIEDGKAHFYSGSYTWYAEEKLRRYTTQAEQYERQQKEIKRLEERAKWYVIQNQFTTKHHHLHKRIEQMDKVEKPVTSKKITEEFNSGGYAGKEIVALNSVSKSYGTNTLLNDVSISIYRNDRIALVGANGCGKTTLLRLITDEEACDTGTIKVSSNVKFAYLPQIIRFDDENATVLDTLRNVINVPENIARSILANFKFNTQDITKKVKSLSGGEKSRLKICLLMQDEVNFLILDEPTNHLDIDSREWVENAVSDWDCTMLFISHDRYFLNKFASKIWQIKDEKIISFTDAESFEYL
ncbi:MAG: ATP-binding cassette domain-containing protein [Oscillospiraceae bacterium]|jgi:ATPase subunit of ABC transporter with duplicated ATPase domains|nr:ATP-binding cassette domain-containing protein [Oscillospiraceae bacterium]